MQILASPKFLKILAVLVVIGIVCRFCYSAGVDAAASDFQAEKLEMIAKQDKVLKKAIEDAKAQARVEHDKVIQTLRAEQAITENTRNVEREIAITTFSCERLPDFHRLFNAAIPD